jgi:hypothetical protein
MPGHAGLCILRGCARPACSLSWAL